MHVLILHQTTSSLLLLVDATYPSVAVSTIESKQQLQQQQQQQLKYYPDENDIRYSQEQALAPLRLLCKGVSSKFCATTTNTLFNSHNVVTRLFYLDYVLQHQMDNAKPAAQQQSANTCTVPSLWETIAAMAMSCLITVCCFIEAFLKWSWNVEFTLLAVSTVILCRYVCLVVTYVPRKKDKRRKNH